VIEFAYMPSMALNHAGIGSNVRPGLPDFAAMTSLGSVPATGSAGSRSIDFTATLFVPGLYWTAMAVSSPLSKAGTNPTFIGVTSYFPNFMPGGLSNNANYRPSGSRSSDASITTSTLSMAGGTSTPVYPRIMMRVSSYA
jgi:hypothetical protein